VAVIVAAGSSTLVVVGIVVKVEVGSSVSFVVPVVVVVVGTSISVEVAALAGSSVSVLVAAVVVVVGFLASVVVGKLLVDRFKLSHGSHMTMFVSATTSSRHLIVDVMLSPMHEKYPCLSVGMFQVLNSLVCPV